jgi:hypothetical protein
MLESHESLHIKGKMLKVNWHHELYNQFCLADAKRLAEILHPLGYNHMVIGFDECRILNQANKKERGDSHLKMSLVALQRAIKAADNFPVSNFSFWYTLLDTSSSIFDLVPQRGKDASSHRLTHTLDPVTA